MRLFPSIFSIVCLLCIGCQPSSTASKGGVPAVKLSAAANINITVNVLVTSFDDAPAVENLWRYVKTEHPSVAANPEAFYKAGLKVGVAGDAFRVKLGEAKRQFLYSEDNRFTYTAAEGSPTYIKVGDEITVNRFDYLGKQYTYLDRDFSRTIRMFKAVIRKPSVDQIEVRLTPFFSQLLSGGSDMELTELSIPITLRPGQFIVLGASDTSKSASEENVAAAMFSYKKYPQKTRSLVTIMPE